MPNPWVHLDGDPLMPAPIPNPIILPDFGNKANYRLGETVTFSVFDDRYAEIAVTLNGRVDLHLPVSREGFAAFCPETPGHYEAFAVSAEGKSDCVEFFVTEASVTTDRTEYPEGTAVNLTFSCTLGDTLMGWMVKTADHAKFLGILRSDDGTLADQVVLPAGSYYIIAHYRNRYGVYSATPSPVFHITGK